MGEEMKIWAIIGKIFRILLYVLVIAFGVSIAIVLIFGLKLYCIQTGSMEPQYPVGMMIVVEPVAFEDLHVGDVVTFVQGDNTVVTHRAVEIDRENRMLLTKGDNNNVADASMVSYQNVIGRVRFGIAGVGYVVLVLNTRLGRWIVVLAAVALIGIALIRRMYYRGADDEPEEPDKTSGETAEPSPAGAGPSEQTGEREQDDRENSVCTDDQSSGINERSGGLSAEKRKPK